MPPEVNPYWNNVTEIAQKQRDKGLKKYGFGLENNNELNVIEVITYAQEEMIDFLMYCEHLKSKLREVEKNESNVYL